MMVTTTFSKAFPLVIPETADTLKKFSASIFEDHDGYKWISVGGIFKVKGDSIVGAVRDIPFVNDAYLDDENMLWLATRGGLFRLNPRTFETRKWLRKDGLPHHILHSIIADDAGNLWIGTQKWFITI